MKDEIARFIRDPDPSRFEALALDLFAWQVRHNPDYAAVTAGARPEAVAWIPAVPVGLFRDLDLTCFPASEACFTFRTSGTSTGRPGIHHLRDSDVYDLSAERGFRGFFPTPPREAVSLIPSPARAPQSSLSHMVGLFYPDARFLVDDQGLPRVDAAWRVLSEASAPIFVAATALALEMLMEGDGSTCLPDGSLVMVTGGYKGRTGYGPAAELLRQVGQRLGARIVGEYGMTELRSQLWTAEQDGATALPEGPFRSPPWLRAIAVDPETGTPLPPGADGQLRFVDLANHDTVLAIETLDHGRVHADGSVTLYGRLPGAPARGCSLTIEEARSRG